MVQPEMPKRCPHLSMVTDPDSYFAFPTNENICRKLDRPQTIKLGWQEARCLGEYGQCPIYQHDGPWNGKLPEQIKAEGRTWQPPTPPGVRNDTLRMVVIVVGVSFAVGALLLFLVLNVIPPNFWLGGALTEQQATGTVAALTQNAPTVTPTPLPTETATPQPTATPTPATPTLTPTITPTGLPEGVVLVEVLEFESFLRAGPGSDFDGLALLPPETEVGVISRDGDGSWLFVQTPDGRRGWIALTQFVGDPNLSVVPIAEDIPTP